MKYTTQHNGGRVSNYPAVNQSGKIVNTGSDEQSGMKTDPSVRLGPLRGEPPGSVPLSRTMQKPQAYRRTKSSP